MKKVLIVEDEEKSRKMIIKKITQLMSGKVEIDQAENGQIGVKFAMELKPDLILLDVEMPVMGGIDAAAIINRQLPDTNIVFLTAYDKFDYAVGALRSGVKDYLLKPVSDNDLQNILNKYIGEISQKEEENSTFNITLEIWLSNHFMENVTMDDAARFVGVNTSYFSRKVKKMTGKNFSEHLTEYRIRRAKEYLQFTDLSISKIGERVGYPDAKYFAKVFKKHEGETPGICRLKLRRNQESKNDTKF